MRIEATYNIWKNANHETAVKEFEALLHARFPKAEISLLSLKTPWVKVTGRASKATGTISEVKAEVERIRESVNL